MRLEHLRDDLDRLAIETTNGTDAQTLALARDVIGGLARYLAAVTPPPQPVRHGDLSRLHRPRHPRR